MNATVSIVSKEQVTGRTNVLVRFVIDEDRRIPARVIERVFSVLATENMSDEEIDRVALAEATAFLEVEYPVRE